MAQELNLQRMNKKSAKKDKGSQRKSDEAAGQKAAEAAKAKAEELRAAMEGKGAREKQLGICPS
jgi:hypothetical protein